MAGVVASAESPSTGDTGLAKSVQDLSTVELVRQITAEVTLLVKKEIELAKTEVKANLKAEAVMLGGLSIAALAGLCTVNLLLVTATFALALLLPAWGAGLIVSGILMLATAVIALLFWNKRVRNPLERTRRTLKDDLRWTRERLV